MPDGQKDELTETDKLKQVDKDKYADTERLSYFQKSTGRRNQLCACELIQNSQ